MFGKIKNVLKILRNKKDKSLTRQTIENSIYSSTTGVVSKIGGLIFTILLARILMPELFGLYNLVLSIVLTIATFTDLGINSALSRYLSESLTKGKKGEIEARSRVRFLFNLKLFLTFGASLILFLLAPTIANAIFKRPEMILPIYFGSLYIFLLSFQGFLSTFFYPLKKLKYNRLKIALISMLNVKKVHINYAALTLENSFLCLMKTDLVNELKAKVMLILSF